MGNGIITILVLLGVLLFNGIFIFLGARLAKVEKRSFKRIALATFVSSLASYSVPIVTRGFGIIIVIFFSLWLQIFLLKTIFATETKRAVVILVLNIVASLIIIAIFLILLFGVVLPAFPQQD